jgi:hypothetical protein
MIHPAIKIEGFFGNVKVCNDLILGEAPHSKSFSDSYSRMAYVKVDGIKSNGDLAETVTSFEPLLCPIADLTIEEQAIAKRNSRSHL